MNLHATVLIFGGFAGVLALLGSCYVVFFGLVGLTAKLPGTSSGDATEPRTRFLVLIPAHNEEKGISPTLGSLRDQDYPKKLLGVLVIADNCADRTASVVRQEGFECWERTAPDAPGKGKALRWALDRQDLDKFDAVVFVDADTRVCPGSLNAMDTAMQRGASAVQGQYEFELADTSYFSLLTFATKRAENNLFWGARQRFGLMGFILGNGFCLKREVIERVPWSAYSIVEDVEYTVQLALAGIRIHYLVAAQVVSRATRRVTDALPQRLRWASGTLQVMAKYVPRLFLGSFRTRSFLLAEMGVALLLTSRFLLFYLAAIAAGCSFLAGAAGSGAILRVVVVLTALLLGLYTGMVVLQIPPVQGGRLRAIVTLPVYVCWMLFVHACAAVGLRRNAWVRTIR